MIEFTNLKVKSYYNTPFSHNFIPIINKPTRAANHNVTIIDHILKHSFDSKIDTGISKVDISDHFSIFSPPNQEMLKQAGIRCLLQNTI